MKSKIAVLTGAGISAESGIKTFRDAGGLWEGHDVMEVASPQGWNKNKALVLDFYNQRRRQMNSVSPNIAHAALVNLEADFDVVLITQNVDNLHERAGSSKIIHLHGELSKARSSGFEELVYDCPGDIQLGDTCDRGTQLRPHIVWFGEMVPMLEYAVNEIIDCEKILIIGTSMQVYPAASLVAYAPKNAEIIYIDPKPHLSYELSLRPNLQVIEEKATIGVPQVVNGILQK
jgi:NAD-dependent deacetylase